MRSSLTSRNKFSSHFGEFEEEVSIVKLNATSSSFHFIEQEEQLKKYKRMVKDLQAMVKEEQRKREEIQEKMRMFSERTVLREKEFHNILEKNFALFSKVDKTEAETKKTQVFKVFDKIFENFDQMNNATNTFIQKRYSENMKSLDSRVSQIMRVLSDQIFKMNRIKNIDRLGLQKSIEEVLSIAKTIQEDNIKTKQRVERQTLRSRLLQEQKQLLIEQVVQKKQLIAKLYLDNKRMKEEMHGHGQDVAGSNGNSGKKCSARSFVAQADRNTEDRSIKNGSERRSKEGKMMPEGSVERSQTVKVHDFITEFNLKHSTGPSPTQNRYSRRYNDSTEKLGSKSFSIKRKEGQKGSTSLSKSVDQSKIIEHLKLSLQREKRKNQELSKMLTKIQNQNQQINSTIAQIIKEHKEGKKDENALQILVKSEKLFEVIRSLKKRLSMIERPSISCGWGNQNIEDQLLNTQKQPTH